MPRKAKPVSGVFEKTEGSGIFYVRYRVNGKLVRKKIGTRSQAVDYLNKVKHIRSSGDGVVPVTAKAPARTSAEIRELMEGSTLGELADGLLQQIISDPERYKDQHNPPLRLKRIEKEFGSRPAASIRPSEVADWLKGLQRIQSDHESLQDPILIDLYLWQGKGTGCSKSC